MPRQRRSPTGEAAVKPVTIRLTPSEHAEIKTKAGRLSLSEFFRRAGLGQPLPRVRHRPPVPEVNRLTYIELGRIGTNVNQLAKACNTAIRLGYGCSIDPQRLEALAATIEQVRLDVLAVVEDEDADEDE